MATKHRPGRRAKSRVRAPSGARERLDWNDAAAVRALMLGLRVNVDDLLAVMDDMLAPARERELGPAQHRRIADECRGSLLAGFDHALPPESAPPAP